MSKASVAAALCFFLGALPALGFRDDLPLDPPRDCFGGSLPASAEFRTHCALHSIDSACADGGSRLPELVAEMLGVHPVQVRKAMGRHTLGDPAQGNLCPRGESERRQVIAASRAAKKVPSEAGQPWLLRELGGADGVIDVAAVGRALGHREEILAKPQLKRAGLPGTPSGWTNLTGYTQSAGRINHILFTSATGNDILAGSDGGGIWRSTNGGTSWTPINDFLGSLSITNLAKAGNDANTIYAGTNAYGSHTYFPFGIIKSTDGGTTWSQVAATNPSTNTDFEYVLRIAVSPINSLHVLAATLRGAYETFNGGNTWTKVGGISTMATFVAFHPSDPNRAAIAYHDGSLRYTTTGNLQGGSATVTVRANGNYMKFAYAKSDLTRMYALVSDFNAPATRLYTSTTGGASWTPQPAHDTALTSKGIFFNQHYLYYTGGLWVDPVTATRVAVFEGWAAFAADVNADPALATTWKALYSGWVDFHAIVEHPGYNGTSNRIVFFMDDGGLYRVNDVSALDDFAQFTRLDSGMTVTQVYGVSGHGGNPILGAQDVAPKVYRTDPSIGDNTLKWRFLRLPADDPQCPGCSWIGDGMRTAASTANPQVLYGSHQYLNLIRSNDGGATAISIVRGTAITEGRGIATPNFNAAFNAPFVLDPSNQSRMYAGGNSLWRSNNVDTGTPPTWQAIRAPLSDNPNCTFQLLNIVAVAVAPSDPNVVWIAYDCLGRVFKSTNALQATPTFTEVTTLPAAAVNRSKASITIDAANPNVVWIGLGQYQAATLFKTTDGGATAGNWTTVSGLPGAPVNALVQHPASGSWLYAGTGVGLFASTDGGASWSTSNEGPANIVVKSLDWNSSGNPAELLVGTFGRGIFKASVTYSPSVDPPPNPPRLANISTRGQVQTGFNVMIGGFVISGATPKTVVVRAIGLSLVNFGVLGALSDPQIQLVRASDNVTIATNDNWQSAANAAQVISSGFAPTNPLESAIHITLQPGAYTAIVSGVGGGTGVGLIEVYEVDHPETPLINISTRGRVQTGFDVMIGGFVIQGSGPQQVVIRAIGPSLANFGVVGALANPTMQLVRISDSVTIATNDDWGSAANAAQVTSLGFAPTNPLESAILITLQPGAYTAVVSGVGGTSGVGLVEVYKVQ